MHCLLENVPCEPDMREECDLCDVRDDRLLVIDARRERDEAVEALRALLDDIPSTTDDGDCCNACLGLVGLGEAHEADCSLERSRAVVARHAPEEAPAPAAETMTWPEWVVVFEGERGTYILSQIPWIEAVMKGCGPDDQITRETALRLLACCEETPRQATPAPEEAPQ